MVRGVVLNVPGAFIGHGAKEDDPFGLQAGQHLAVAVHEHPAGVAVFHGTHGGNSHRAALRLSVEAPRIAVPVRPADGGHDRKTQLLPVCAQLVLAPVIVDLHRRGVIREQREVRGHDGPEAPQKHGVSDRVVPHPQEQVIINEKMHAEARTGLLLQSMVEAYPLDALVQMDGVQSGNAVCTDRLEPAQIKVVPVAFYRFQCHEHLLRVAKKSAPTGLCL